MRRYEDPVEVRRGPVDATLGPGTDELAPAQFLWRGRLWKVRAVLAHWVETGPWWQPGPVGADLLAERELWRVEAGRGLVAAGGEGDGGGVFDLSFDWSDGRWQLVGCED